MKKTILAYLKMNGTCWRLIADLSANQNVASQHLKQYKKWLSKVIQDINFDFLFITECLNYFFFLLAGTGQGLKLTLNVESEEYMAGPLSGLGVLVSMFKYKCMDTNWTMSLPPSTNVTDLSIPTILANQRPSTLQPVCRSVRRRQQK